MSNPIYKKTVVAIAVVAGLLVCLIGCGKRQTVVYDQPELPRGGHWETAWVDPQLLLTDTLFTLIRTERIDSFYVDEPLPLELQPTAIHFQVDATECFVAVSIVDDRGSILKPLIAQTLATGYYKFTLFPHQLDPRLRAATGLFIKAFYCGDTRLEPIDFD